MPHFSGLIPRNEEANSQISLGLLKFDLLNELAPNKNEQREFFRLGK